MGAKRIERVNQLIKREIAELILREIEVPSDVLVTVTRAQTTKDLRDSNVFVSVFPGEKAEEIMAKLGGKIGLLQRELNKLLKIKPLPRLNFLKEKETAEAGRIEEILEQLKKEEK